MTEDWRERASCRGTAEPEIFFSLKGPDKKAAKALCATCPVRRECLESSLEHEDRFGIFGGADHYERRRAMQINGEGYATSSVKPIRCPFCLGKNVITVLKRRAWMRVSCTQCDLTWVAKRVVPRKKTTTQETSTGDGQAVEPAVSTGS